MLSAVALPVDVTSPVGPAVKTAQTTLRVVSRPDLSDELAEKNRELESASAETILAWAAERFGDRITMATAFGPEGMVIIHLLAQVAPQLRVFNLDTGYQFPETLAMVDRIRERYGLDVELRRPAQSVAEWEAENGGPVYHRDPDRCCFERKLRVLRESIAGMDAWITAIRRDQSPDRAGAPIVGWDHKFDLVKVNPLANWTKSHVWKLIVDERIPYNPLHDQGYTSIGCWPCTRSGHDRRG